MTIGWFFDAHPLTWAGINNIYVSWISAYIIWLISSLFLAIFVGLWGYSFQKRILVFHEPPGKDAAGEACALIRPALPIPDLNLNYYT